MEVTIEISKLGEIPEAVEIYKEVTLKHSHLIGETLKIKIHGQDLAYFCKEYLRREIERMIVDNEKSN